MRLLRSLAAACLMGCSLAWASPAPPMRAVPIQVDPPEAVLVLDGQEVKPLRGTYLIEAGELAAPQHPLLRSPGFRDVSLPELSRDGLASYQPGGPYALAPYSLRAYARRYPWVPALVLLGGVGCVGLLLRKPPPAAPLLSASAYEALSGTEADPMLGAVVGRYLVTEHLGAGGMATVYKALPLDDRRESEAVAIKVIRPDQISVEFRQRFEREIRISMKLNHPNVLRIIDWGCSDHQSYLVMEFVDGVPLTRCIPPDGLSLPDAMGFLPSIFEALAYAHSLGIVHRDLKPDNVMVLRNGRVKLMDFGLARSQDVATVTVMGTAMGTPQYMAPEQILRGPQRSGLTDRSDQYALGILIFQVLTGRPPYDWDDDPMALVMMHLTREPLKLRALRPELPGALERVVARMLDKEAERRYASIKDAGAALFEAVEAEVPALTTAEFRAALAAILPPRNVAASPDSVPISTGDSGGQNDETQAFHSVWVTPVNDTGSPLAGQRRSESGSQRPGDSGGQRGGATTLLPRPD